MKTDWKNNKARVVAVFFFGIWALAFGVRAMPFAEVYYLLIKAELGDVAAQIAIGEAYETGFGTNQDSNKAFEWWHSAAEKGNVDAQYAIGEMYDSGTGVKQDYVEAAKWYLKAAAQGHADAQICSGQMYEKGRGVNQNTAEALQWYLRAAAQGYAGAQYRIGNIYGTGEGVKQDYVEAFFWRSLPAKAKYPDVANRLTPEQIETVKKRVADWKPAPSAATERAQRLFISYKLACTPAQSAASLGK